MPERGPVRVEPWGAGNLPLLEMLLRDPAMTEHVGGPESSEKIAERHGRYAQAGSGQFRIVAGAPSEAVGWVRILGAHLARRGDLRDRVVGDPGLPGARHHRSGNRQT